LILIPHKDAAYDIVVRSTNNLPETKTLLANYLNIRDLLGYDKLVVPLASLDVLTTNLG
jgi:large subunit ribosomal protein L4